MTCHGYPLALNISRTAKLLAVPLIAYGAGARRTDPAERRLVAAEANAFFAPGALKRCIR